MLIKECQFLFLPMIDWIVAIFGPTLQLNASVASLIFETRRCAESHLDFCLKLPCRRCLIGFAADLNRLTSSWTGVTLSSSSIELDSIELRDDVSVVPFFKKNSMAKITNPAPIPTIMTRKAPKQLLIPKASPVWSVHFWGGGSQGFIAFSKAPFSFNLLM